MTATAEVRRERAIALHAAGVDANADMRPVLAGRRLRRALEELGGPDEDDPPGRTLRGRILVSLALAESEQGHVDEGLRLLAEAESCLPPAARGPLYGQRGILLRRTGRDDLAVGAYAAALDVLDEAVEPEEVARVLLNRAVLHLAAVHLRPARADLRRCLELAGRHRLGRLAAKAGHNLGYLDYLAGDIPAALRQYSQAAQQYAEHATGMLPVLSLDRARALLAAGLFTDADSELQRAIDQLGRQRASQDYAEAHLARAEAALLAGRPVAARRHALRAHQLFARRDNPRWAARSLLTSVRAELASGGRHAASVGDRADALQDQFTALGMPEDARVAGLVEARALVGGAGATRAADKVVECAARRTDRLDTRLLWRLAAAEVAASAGDRRRASHHLSAGLETLHRHRGRFGALDLQTGAAVHGRELARQGLRQAIAGGDVREIFRWGERARAQALLLPAVRPPEDPEVAGWVEELRGVRTALGERELAGRGTRELRVRNDELERHLREHSWFAAGSGEAASPVTLPRMRAELGGAAMVMYLSDGRGLLALVLTPGGAELVGLGRAAPAQEALLRLRADLDVTAGRWMPERLAHTVQEATRRDAATLGALILDPVLEVVGDRELVVLPTGDLISVPWSVLPAAVGRPVTVAPSATSWSAARTRLLPALDRNTRTLLVAGPGIAGGADEVRAIAAIAGSATLLTGPRATARATIEALPGVEVAHLAAHGRHQTDNALFSGLELVGGPLMGYDVQGVARAPAMVVLSACDVGLHDVRPGDESLGMASALLSAGSSTVVASVCRIADDTAPATMTAFYRALADGHPPATALALASPSTPGFVCFGAG